MASSKSAVLSVDYFCWLVSCLVFWTQSTTRDYIRTDKDFHKEIKVEMTSKAEIRPEDRVRKRRVVWKMYELKYS